MITDKDVTTEQFNNFIEKMWLRKHSTTLSQECLSRLVQKFGSILDFAELEPEQYSKFFKKVA